MSKLTEKDCCAKKKQVQPEDLNLQKISEDRLDSLELEDIHRKREDSLF